MFGIKCRHDIARPGFPMEIMKTALAALVCLLASSSLNAQEAVFVIRHAEQELTGGVDAGLLPEGRERADYWATILRPSGLDLVVFGYEITV